MKAIALLRGVVSKLKSKSIMSIISDQMKPYENTEVAKVGNINVNQPDNPWLEAPDLHGMKILDKTQFEKTVRVPCVEVSGEQLSSVLKLLKTHFLKVMNLKAVQPSTGTNFKILLNPSTIKSFNDFDESIQEKLRTLQICDNNLMSTEVRLGYDNWNADTILRSVLPKDKEPLSSYSQIGHIVHVNLRDHLLEYKYLIGEILLDKIKTAKTVVNKVDKIENEFRVFEMELLCGEDRMVTMAKENKTMFELDLSRVYWNPRLSTEHERVTDLLTKSDVLFDVFCGIGPFAIPAAKRGCRVFANDLNPDSYKWLNHNIKLNKVQCDRIKTYNVDAHLFITEHIHRELLTLWSDDTFTGSVHVTMNLPATAISFINDWRHLYSDSELDASGVGEERVRRCLPRLHLYAFVTDEDPEVFFDTNTDIGQQPKVHFVRKVSPKKNMMRFEFELPFEYLVRRVEEPPVKKARADTDTLS